MFKVIKCAFMQRRKTFLNGISNSNIASKDKIKQILEKLEIDVNVRGESLTLNQFAEISNLL